jgi:hypothetical protein
MVKKKKKKKKKISLPEMKLPAALLVASRCRVSFFNVYKNIPVPQL